MWLIDKEVRQREARTARRRKRYFDRGRYPNDLRPGQLVLKKVEGLHGNPRKLLPKYEGPYRIVDFTPRSGPARAAVLEWVGDEHDSILTPVTDSKRTNTCVINLDKLRPFYPHEYGILEDEYARRYTVRHTDARAKRMGLKVETIKGPYLGHEDRDGEEKKEAKRLKKKRYADERERVATVRDRLRNDPLALRIRREKRDRRERRERS